MTKPARHPPRLDDRPVVVLYRSPLFNDSETFVQAHATGLVRYQPLIAGLEDKANAGPELRQNMVLPDSAWARLRFKLFGSAEGFAARLRPAAPVLVHAHFGTDGLLALPLAGALGVPLVTTLHGYDVSRSRARLLASGRLSWVKYGLFRRRLMHSGELFLAVCEAVRRSAVAMGYPEARTRVHYLGVDLGRFPPGVSEAEPGLILHVGRLVEKKGTAILLDAFARVRAERPDARLVVIGDGREQASLERRIAALGLGRSTCLLGALPRDEVAAWMRRAWVLAVPSVVARDGDSEGLPTVLVEACASALPAVGSDHAGIPEAIADGESGFIVPERDAAALAGRLSMILGSAELRHRMARAARALAEERFDEARQNRLLEARYDALLGRGGGARQMRS